MEAPRVSSDRRVAPILPPLGETVRFALDGREYEIDLGTENAEKLRAALAGYVDAGRRIGGPASRQTTSRRGSSRSVDEIRAWARENGFTVSNRGRIPAAVEAAYNAR